MSMINKLTSSDVRYYNISSFVRDMQKGAAEFDDFWGLKWAEQEVPLAETSDDLESIVSGCINTPWSALRPWAYLRALYLNLSGIYAVNADRTVETQGFFRSWLIWGA